MPTLLVGENCLWFREPSDSDPVPAVVVKSTAGGVLMLAIFRPMARELDYRRGVRHRTDPVLIDNPNLGRDQANGLGGVWDYVKREREQAIPVKPPVEESPKVFVEPSHEQIVKHLKELETKQATATQMAIAMEEFTGSPWNYQKVNQYLARIHRQERETVTAQ